VTLSLIWWIVQALGMRRRQGSSVLGAPLNLQTVVMLKTVILQLQDQFRQMDPNTCFHLMFHHLPLHFFQVFLIPDFP
jgi:hypothetical protein